MRPQVLASAACLVPAALASQVSNHERADDLHRPAKDTTFLRFGPNQKNVGNVAESDSPGECAVVKGFNIKKCGSVGSYTEINAHTCYSRCFCKGGTLYCNSLGECSSEDMLKWCKCPGGSNAENKCLGFMSLCYCAPEDYFEGYGVWGAGREVMREYTPSGLGGDK